MLVLFEHTDYFKWKTLAPGELIVDDDAPLEGEATNALVAFTTILQEDLEGKDVAKLLDKACEKIYQAARKVNAQVIVLYPFAHLTNAQLANPHFAVQLLKQIERGVSAKNRRLRVVRTPFGWHKQREARTASHNKAIAFKEVKV